MAGTDGKKGDLLIEIHIDPDSEYTRKGLDLYTSAQIPYATAVLGGEAMLPTLHGQVSCKIPAGIQSGSKIRLKEKGIHTEGRSPKKGDEFVEIRIAVPRNISPAAKKKLEALRATFTDEDGAIAHYPVCIAKTQFSFTADSTRYGSPEGFTIRIRDIILNCGSEMIVAIAGDMLRMPGLPRSPQAERITIENGQIEGLS